MPCRRGAAQAPCSGPPARTSPLWGQGTPPPAPGAVPLSRPVQEEAGTRARRGGLRGRPVRLASPVRAPHGACDFPGRPLPDFSRNPHHPLSGATGSGRGQLGHTREEGVRRRSRVGRGRCRGPVCARASPRPRTRPGRGAHFIRVFFHMLFTARRMSPADGGGILGSTSRRLHTSNVPPPFLFYKTSLTYKRGLSGAVDADVCVTH